MDGVGRVGGGGEVKTIKMMRLVFDVCLCYSRYYARYFTDRILFSSCYNSWNRLFHPADLKVEEIEIWRN